MEKEMKITAPNGCEIEKVEIVDGVAVVTFRDKERKLPKSWEEFCKNFGTSKGTYGFDSGSKICSGERPSRNLNAELDKQLLPDRETAEAVLTLCQLIQLRNCYNGDWVPDWTKDEPKFVIQLNEGEFVDYNWCGLTTSFLYFKTADLRDEFLRYFRPLIEKLKPLYGIMAGGAEC